MSKLSYEYYVDIVTKQYFDSVDNKRLDGIIGCFAEDGFIHEMTSNTKHEGRDNGVKAMFERLCADNGRIWHGNFVHTVDVENRSICSQFSVEIEPKELGSEEQRYENCNRFYLDENGKFKRVYVYMSGSNLLK